MDSLNDACNFSRDHVNKPGLKDGSQHVCNDTSSRLMSTGSDIVESVDNIFSLLGVI